MLHAHRVSLEKWGVGEANSLDSLLLEIDSGECKLNLDAEHGIVRVVPVVALDVYAKEKKFFYILRETKQVLRRSGTIRNRGIDTSIGEKIKKVNTPFPRRGAPPERSFQFTSGFRL